MKLKTNQDLLKIISFANDGYSLENAIKKCAKSPASYIIFGVTILDYILISLEDCYKPDLEGIVLSCSINFLNAGVIAKLLDASLLNNFIDKKIKAENFEKLEELSLALLKLEFDTTGELLMDAKLDSKNYKFEYKDSESNIKKLKEYKYIDVPLKNGESKILLQEHFIGTKEFELTSPPDVTEYQLKLCKNPT